MATLWALSLWSLCTLLGLQGSVVDTNSVYRTFPYAIPVLTSRWQNTFLLVSGNGAGLYPPRGAPARTFTELCSTARHQGDGDCTVVSLRPGGEPWPLTSCLLSAGGLSASFVLPSTPLLYTLRHRRLPGKYLLNKCHLCSGGPCQHWLQISCLKLGLVVLLMERLAGSCSE